MKKFTCAILLSTVFATSAFADASFENRQIEMLNKQRELILNSDLVRNNQNLCESLVAGLAVSRSQAMLLSLEVVASTERLDMKSTCGRTYVEKANLELNEEADLLRKSVQKMKGYCADALRIMENSLKKHQRNASALGEDAAAIQGIPSSSICN